MLGADQICRHSSTSGPSLNITTYKTPNDSIYLTNYTIVLVVIISRFIAVVTQYTGLGPVVQKNLSITYLKYYLNSASAIKRLIITIKTMV